MGQDHFCITYLSKCISKHNFLSKKQDVECQIDILRLVNLKDHLNIVSLKDVMEDNENVYIMLELCKGGKLYCRMVERSAYPHPQATKLIDRNPKLGSTLRASRFTCGSKRCATVCNSLYSFFQCIRNPPIAEGS